MLRQQVKCPCERTGSGFVAGQQQRHHLIAQLRVWHAVAVFVAGIQQHAEQIARLFAACTPLSNEAVDDVIQLLERAPESPP